MFAFYPLPTFFAYWNSIFVASPVLAKKKKELRD